MMDRDERTRRRIADLRRNRRMVVVDIENVIRHACKSRQEAADARGLVTFTIGSRPQDVVVIGSDASGLLDAALGWGGGVRAVVGRHANGADLALLQVLEENVADRFDEVVLVSGDGIFTDAVASLGAQDVRTTVVAHRDALSNRLRMAARSVLYFSSPTSPTVRVVRATPPAVITRLHTSVHKEAA